VSAGSLVGPVRTPGLWAGLRRAPGGPWLLVGGLAAHGLKDLWQHRSHFVANTRWWPPFCLVVDWVAAAIIAVEITAGVDLHG
jgi:hypothetical protein